MNKNESNTPSGEVPEETPEQAMESAKIKAAMAEVEAQSMPRTEGENPYSTKEGEREMQRKKLEESGEWEADGKVSFERFDGDVKKGLESLFAGTEILQATLDQIADELIAQADHKREAVYPSIIKLAMHLGVDSLFFPIWDRGQSLYGNEKEKIVQAVQKSINTTKRVKEFQEQKSSETVLPKENIPTKPELSPEDIQQAEAFIDTFVASNENLTPEAKEMLTNKAKSQRGAWSVKGFVQAVTQEGKKITIKTKSGESFLHTN